MRALNLLPLLTLVACFVWAEEQPRAGEKTLGIKLKGPATFTLDDGEALHKEFPKTFWIPSAAERKNLKEGDLVKLIFRLTDGTDVQVERMWVIVKSKTDKGYKGVLDNDPYCTQSIKSGLEVHFEPKHVITIDDSPAKK
jgi:uncharacterized protein YegJ (DUF2314 family)